MDTESIISALVSAKSTKVTNLKNEQKKLEWKQTAWQDLNSKIYSFYSKTLSDMRLSGSYTQKTTKVSDSTKASIVASGSAVNGTQTLKIKSLAKSAYLTGARVDRTVETMQGTQIPSSVNNNVDGNTKLTALSDVEKGTGNNFQVGDKIKIEADGLDNPIEIEVTADTTINDFLNEVNKYKGVGVSASFDNDTKKLSISTAVDSANVTETGIKITASRADSATGSVTDISSIATKALGLGGEITSSKSGFASDSKLSAINSELAGKTITITTGTDEDKKTTDIEITNDMTISDFVTKLKEAGVNASFDETNQRFFVSAKSTGLANDFSITAKDSDGNTDPSALGALGLLTSSDSSSDNSQYATKVAASDAEIYLNNAKFTSDTNTFSINGLTINVTGTTSDDEELTITTDTDYDGIYNKIKDFISEYNEIINDIYQKYNADSARDYDMLTDDEKETMTDDEIETWEDTIKASLLRKDTTLSTLMSSITSVMNDSYGVDASTGKKRYLFTYGIETLGYFEAEEGERYALHIAGDPDDENTSSDDDLLKTALANDPDGTIDFFTSLCKKLYSTLNTAMTATDYSSIYKVYDDKRLQTEYDDYTTKISEAEDKLADYEDKWYSKFSSMETALSKLQSTQSVVSSMLGTS
jgi:flagellar hook-associated protein 2